MAQFKCDVGKIGEWLRTAFWKACPQCSFLRDELSKPGGGTRESGALYECPRAQEHRGWELFTMARSRAPHDLKPIKQRPHWEGEGQENCLALDSAGYTELEREVHWVPRGILPSLAVAPTPTL